MDTAKSLYKGGKARVLGLDGKTSIFDHGKVRLAKRRKCSDNQPMARALA